MILDILFAAELHAEQASAKELKARIAGLKALRPYLNDDDHDHAGVVLCRLARLLEAQLQPA